MYEALRDYLKDSELRIADENLYIRMSSELAKKYDAGDYDIAVAEHIGCIRELTALNLLPDNDKKFYIYLVPDDCFADLLMYPYRERDGGGRPVGCFEKDGFCYAYGSSQNRFSVHREYSAQSHANNIHEYCHLIFEEFYPKRHQLFHEGFSELIPWYLLDYDIKDKNKSGKIRYHIDEVLSGDIYSADQLLGTKNVFLDQVVGATCAFQKSYISAYMFMRLIIEKIQEKYNLDKVAAVKMFLSWGPKTTNNSGLLITEFANKLGLNVEKLLYTTDYQKEVLQEMSNFVKINGNTIKPTDAIKI